MPVSISIRGLSDHCPRGLTVVLLLFLTACGAGLRPVAAPDDPPAVFHADPAVLSRTAAYRVGVYPFLEPDYAPQTGAAAAEAMVRALRDACLFPEVLPMGEAVPGTWIQTARSRSVDLIVVGTVSYLFEGSGVSASRVVERMRLVRVEDGRTLFILEAVASGHPEVCTDLFGDFHRTGAAPSTGALFFRNARRFAAQLQVSARQGIGNDAAIGLEKGYRRRIEALDAGARQLEERLAAERQDREALQGTVARLEEKIAEMKRRPSVEAAPEESRVGAPGAVIAPDHPVRFESGSTILNWEAKKSLYRIVEALKDCPGCRIRVEGHSDRTPGDRGASAANWRISSDRALTVLRFLAERGGIDPSRMVAVGFGDHRPKASNDTADGRAANRRVEVVAVPGKPGTPYRRSAGSPPAAVSEAPPLPAER